jgi:hypothetical protein
MYAVTENINDESILREFRKIQAVLQSITAGNLLVTFVPPLKPFEGQVLICDGVKWDPLLDGIKRPIWFDGIVWKPFN